LKLFFDHHLSHKLVAKLADIFPDSSHTRLLGFSRTSDSDLWWYAKRHEYILVTKDEDIPELAVLRGAPPKVVWLRLGNCKTAVVERLIRRNVLRIQQLADDDERVILELFGDD
jgi:predicted nuclease of predicted toxin-antitoxin system